MSNLFDSSRCPTFARDAMIATSHPLATNAGLEILREGGNAVDAALAASATLCVVEPHMTGIGGDCFVLYAPTGTPVVALNGSGLAPAAVSAEKLLELGFSDIPQKSAHAVTIPGAIAAWVRLHNDYGSLPLDRLFLRAIDYAENGYPVTARVAQDWASESANLAGSGAAELLFVPNGATPRAGERHSQPVLGRSLREIAKHGAKGFYAGRTAEKLVAFLNERGGFHSMEDFERAADRSVYVKPITTSYRGYEVMECPPNGQGLAALLILNILESFDLGADVSMADRIHLHAEATKIAYHHRDALIADPAQYAEVAEALLGEETAKILRNRIDGNRAGVPKLWTDTEHKDTVYLCVVDRDGNAISFINSIFSAFGSTLLDPDTGILLHNRGCSFRLDPSHPNALAPDKRPMHTIIPGMLRKDGQTVAPFGVMGGHYQAAGHASLLDGLIDQGLDVQAALAAPRSFAFNGLLEVEPSIGTDVRNELARRGHSISVRTSPIGGGQIIWIDQKQGTLIGGSDLRKDGCALGF